MLYASASPSHFLPALSSTSFASSAPTYPYPVPIPTSHIPYLFFALLRICSLPQKRSDLVYKTQLILLLARRMGQYCFACSRLSSSSVTLPAGWRTGRWARWRSTLHGGPVVLRPVRATPYFIKSRTFRWRSEKACTFTLLLLNCTWIIIEERTLQVTIWRQNTRTQKKMFLRHWYEHGYSRPRGKTPCTAENAETNCRRRTPANSDFDTKTKSNNTELQTRTSFTSKMPFVSLRLSAYGSPSYEMKSTFTFIVSSSSIKQITCT